MLPLGRLRLYMDMNFCVQAARLVVLFEASTETLKLESSPGLSPRQVPIQGSNVSRQLSPHFDNFGMFSQPLPTDLFDVTVNDLLIIPEIQEVLKRDAFEDESVSTTVSMTSYSSSPLVAGIRDAIAESESDDAAEKLQVGREQEADERPMFVNSTLPKRSDRTSHS